jgi:hypothetical protein
MGVSTDAIILYGIEMEEYVTPKWLSRVPGFDKNDLVWSAEKALEEDGMCIQAHGSDEYPMYCLAVKSSVIKARRGCPKSLDLKGEPFDEVEYLERRFNNFANKYGVDGKPGWLLISWWH